MEKDQEFEKFKLEVPSAWKRFYRMYPTEAWRLMQNWRNTVYRHDILLRLARQYVASYADMEGSVDAVELLRKIDVELSKDFAG